jgi:hypothetical protein
MIDDPSARDPEPNSFDAITAGMDFDLSEDTLEALEGQEEQQRKSVEYWRQLQEEVKPALDAFLESDDPLGVRLRSRGFAYIGMSATTRPHSSFDVTQDGLQVLVSGEPDESLRRKTLARAVAWSCLFRIEETESGIDTVRLPTPHVDKVTLD